MEKALSVVRRGRLSQMEVLAVRIAGTGSTPLTASNTVRVKAAIQAARSSDMTGQSEHL